ncbi:inactive pancreatic lipase-related protein 1-like isoform X2 [Hyposmocoma kahamanoa]|uniref:inactive pancreatic lipase-related protein 1-like isoform X2 n=1 Tax=Hyposmocoma kahamanoa TaxID=1477025 RepID=UPI000E6D87A1|nr:inactive pancreatic lipase-related protein 1-like isoform X2 [Hyposmocoma kahamanoa]
MPNGDFDWCSILSLGIINILNDCIEPQLKCPNSNITFWLYTRQNQHNPYQLLANDSNSMTLAPFVKNSPVKLLIHGYTGNRNRSPNKELRSAYFKCCDYNIISVDYNPLASGRCYIQGAHNAKLVGMCIAQLVDELVQNHGFNLSLIHPIGFSLGGQIAGFIGNYLKSGRLYRITGLDPALPMFWTFDDSKKLDAGDARFVDILHTNSFIRGKFESTGTIDFFANNGMIQPGCSSTKAAGNLIKFIQAIADFNTQSSCSHARAVAYFAESINSKVGFHAMKCTTWIGYMVGLCGLLHSSRQDVLFGERVPLK